MLRTAASASAIVDVRFWHKADIPAYPDLCPLSGVKETF